VQQQAIEDELAILSAAFDTVLQAQAENGRLTKQVESAGERQEARLLSLNEAVGGIVKVDLAEVAVRLNQAQFAYEASASVFNSLRGMSLLNVLDL
jgi:flagellar hook-associated protein 3 FlgL